MLVDCPPSLGVLTLNALAAASHLVLVTEPSFLALQGIDELLETRDLVHAHYNNRPRWPAPGRPQTAPATSGLAERGR